MANEDEDGNDQAAGETPTEVLDESQTDTSVAPVSYDITSYGDLTPRNTAT